MAAAIRISVADLESLELKPLVVYRLKDGVAVGEWELGTKIFSVQLERDGAATADGIFRPKDGRRFMEALALAFSNSSLVVIEELDDE